MGCKTKARMLRRLAKFGQPTGQPGNKPANQPDTAPQQPATGTSAPDAQTDQPVAQSPPQQQPQPLPPIKAFMPGAGDTGTASNQPAQPGKYVADRSHNADGFTPLDDAKLRHRAVRNNWIVRDKPWPLNAKLRDFEQFERDDEQGQLDVVDSITKAVLEDVTGSDAKVRQNSARTGVLMRGQNLGDIHHGERMDYHERSLQARVPGMRVGVGVTMGGQGIAGGGGGNAAAQAGEQTAHVGVAIFLPHNFRDEMPNLIDGDTLPIPGIAQPDGD